MTAKCKICNKNLHIGPDSLVLCAHKKGFVHRGCCVAHCSKHGEPCIHAKAEYAKKEPQFTGEMFAFLDEDAKKEPQFTGEMFAFLD